MSIVLFASPGILGPYTLATLIHLKKDVRYLILPSSWHALPATELLQLAEGANIPVLTPQNLHDNDFVMTLKQCMPDLMIVATFDKRIPSDVIQIPRLGAINIHSSFLPAYRGACPEFWVMRNGAQETGVSIHLLNEEFDKGDIIVQGKVSISPRDTVGVLLYRIASASSKLLMQVLAECEKGNVLTGTPQNEQAASDAPLVKPPDMRIDWKAQKTDIYNLIRAANPVGGAWALFRGFQIQIWYAREAREEELPPTCMNQVQPGRLCIEPARKQVFVRCQDGFLELRVVQLALYYIIDAWTFTEMALVKDGESLD